MLDSPPALPAVAEGPVQIVNISAEGDRFFLDERKLAFVFKQIPKDMKVSIVSVVGAFRTGKSFLLDFFLRYLRYYDRFGTDEEHSACSDGRSAWLWGDGEEKLEGRAGQAPDVSAMPTDSATVSELRQRRKIAQADSDGGQEAAVSAESTEDAFGRAANSREAAAPASADGGDSDAGAGAESGKHDARSGFKWRSGYERTTTGIWLWSRPFIRRLPGSREKVAVLLMDTQGMFDSETSQMLTACIFGLSTLIASYQIYNVQNRIQEDNLQHLALFAEYGRMVFSRHDSDGRGGAAADDDAEDGDVAAGAAAGAAGAGRPAAPEGAISKLQKLKSGQAGAGAAAGGDSGDAVVTPFQSLEFLVRDARITTSDLGNAPALNKEFSTYLEGILAKTHHEDLRSVREHIRMCFSDLSCWMLPHPGEHVAESDAYDGAIASIRDKFRVLLETYVSHVFNESLQPKTIHGHAVTAIELQRFVAAYCRLFQDRAIFPQAKVLLEATADANNQNAYDLALADFRRAMDGRAGLGKSYMKEDALVAFADECTAAALTTFAGRANFGSARKVAEKREGLLQVITDLRGQYLEANRSREPFRNIELVVLPLAIAVAAWMLRLVSDYTCAPWSDVCRRGSQFLGFVYTSIFLIMLIVVWRSGAVFWQRARNVMQTLQTVANAAGSAAGPPAAAAAAGARGAGGAS